MDSGKPRLCMREHSILLIVDIQERLAAAMVEDAREMVFRGAGILSQAAAHLEIPTFLTEQYPKGLGPTHEAVRRHLSGARRLEKTTFSCCGAAGFQETLLATGRRQVVLAGMEAHVCVLQTALDLDSEGFQVFVVEDGVCSRDARNARNALSRLRHEGVTVTNTESVVFEWLRDSSHPRFKEISALVR